MTGSGRAVRSGVLILLLSVTAACEKILGPSTPDENWRAYDSRHFTLYVRPASFAEENVGVFGEALDDQYETTVRALGLGYTGRVTGYLYASAAEADLESNFSGVGYPQTEAFRAVCVPPLSGSLIGLLSHEANHAILIAALGRAGTAFVSEGLASAVLSERFYPVGRSFLHRWSRMNASRIPPLATLVDNTRWAEHPTDVAYNSSGSFLAYLFEADGAQPLRQIYYLSSRDFERRFREVYGRSLQEVEGEWRAFCARWPD